MDKRKLIIGFLITIFIGTISLTQNATGQILKRTLFEPGNISTEFVEYGPSFSPSGKEFYFAKSEDKWGTRGMKSSIYYSVKKDGKWSEPQLVSFSGQYDDSDPHLTKDGKTLYFISQRPSDDVDQISSDIWMTEKDKFGNWGTPVRLSDSVNSPETEYSPRTDKEGNLYFASTRPGGFGQGDLYMALKDGNKFDVLINLGNAVNSEKGEWNLEISQDGKVLIFEASEREQNLSPYGDLYISFKKKNEWSVPQHLKELNTTGSDLTPYLSPKEKMLYYASSDSLKSPDVNIYFVDFEALCRKYKKDSE